MKSYVFYTSEGFTKSPSGEPVENLQILGFEQGTTKKEALQNLLKNNEWIEKSGFDVLKIHVRQLLDAT
jgi:hypothetical protein